MRIRLFMNLRDKVVIVTGAAHGIGRGLCERFAMERPQAIIAADIDETAVRQVAGLVGGEAIPCDVRSEPQIIDLVRSAEDRFGRIDLFCANAGIAMPGGLELANERWREVIEVNLMSHVYAVRAVLPGMLRRGEGYLLHTASAAGLLTEISSASYSVTKHAVVALAEWLAISFGEAGIQVSCLCPQGVRTRMIEGDDPRARMLQKDSISVEDVAESVVAGIAEQHFLILPHLQVAEYFQHKADDYDRWLRGMQRLRKQMLK